MPLGPPRSQLQGEKTDEVREVSVAWEGGREGGGREGREGGPFEHCGGLALFQGGRAFPGVPRGGAAGRE